MQEGQSRQKHPKRASQKVLKGARVLSVQVFNHFSSLYFWQKAVSLRKGRWEAQGGLKSAAGVGWSGDRDGTFGSGWKAHAAFPVVLLSVTSELLPTTWVIKTN